MSNQRKLNFPLSYLLDHLLNFVRGIFKASRFINHQVDGTFFIKENLSNLSLQVAYQREGLTL